MGGLDQRSFLLQRVDFSWGVFFSLSCSTVGDCIDVVECGFFFFVGYGGRRMRDGERGFILGFFLFEEGRDPRLLVA